MIDINNSMKTEQEALEYLEKDILHYADMITFIKENKAKVLYFCDDCVLIFEEKTNVYMITSKTERSLTSALKLIKNPEMVVAHEEFTVDIIKNKFELKDYNKCYQCVYIKKELPKINSIIEKYKLNQVPFEIKELDLSFVDTVNEIYHLFDDREYFKQLISENKIFGAFVNKKLAGFIGIHAEGSLGMLEIVPRFKRMGIASALEAYMINKRISDGAIAFGQVIEGNIPSTNLQKNMNFSFSTEKIFWIFN